MTLAEAPRDARRGRVWEAVAVSHKSTPTYLPTIKPLIGPGGRVTALNFFEV